MAVPHNLLLAPFKVSIIARLSILIQALLHSSCSVQSLSSRSNFFESKLEVVLSELVCICERWVLVSVGGDRILIITTIVPELVVAAHIDILMSLVEDVGLSGKQKLSMVIYTRVFKRSLIARLKLIIRRVTLLSAICKIDGWVAEVLLHALALLGRQVLDWLILATLLSDSVWVKLERVRYAGVKRVSLNGFCCWCHLSLWMCNDL